MLVCPDDTTILIDEEDALPEMIWNEPDSWDNSGLVSVTSSHQSNEHFPVGTTDVMYTATDPYGNFDTCNFTVKIIGKCV